MKFADKACPVVFRDPSLQQILAFEHPKAGLQLVKGRIVPGENARAGCKAAGERNRRYDRQRPGTWHSEHKGHIWSFQLCTFTKLPETWTHYCADDGGHDFNFLARES